MYLSIFDKVLKVNSFRVGLWARPCLSFSIPGLVSQTSFWMNPALLFCVGGLRPGLFPESCLVSSQGSSAADSSSCGRRASLLLWGPGSGRCVGSQVRPDSPCPRGPEAAQLHSSLWGVGWLLGGWRGWGFFCSARCTWTPSWRGLPWS